MTNNAIVSWMINEKYLFIQTIFSIFLINWKSNWKTNNWFSTLIWYEHTTTAQHIENILYTSNEHGLSLWKSAIIGNSFSKTKIITKSGHKFLFCFMIYCKFDYKTFRAIEVEETNCFSLTIPLCSIKF